uniref:N-acyl-aromatic-L-amino acid amidohydrolase n=1 Tax=Scleropages formosus TaxID=113540 RepID=A0A8C9RSP8_SCLFO
MVHEGAEDPMAALGLPALSRVAICGGTHGNELSGVYLLRELQKSRQEEAPDSVALVTVMSNPRAVQQCRRYTETDLNRCFTDATLSSPISDRTPYEIVRAQELNALLGPKGSADAVDLVCDLHNTTANMGLCFISYSDCDWICLHICRHLQMPSTPVRYLHYNIPQSEAYSLESVGKHGFAMEIGPQPHGVIRADIMGIMAEGVRLMLDWVCRFNSGEQFKGDKMEVYTLVRNVDYPRDPATHSIIAAIHPQLQDRDFCLLHHGDPLFLHFSGKTECYPWAEPLYPFFVNEGAYYEKGIALSLAHKNTVGIPPICVQRD